MQAICCIFSLQCPSPARVEPCLLAIAAAGKFGAPIEYYAVEGRNCCLVRALIRGRRLPMMHNFEQALLK
jgi:hypothetical protein